MLSYPVGANSPLFGLRLCLFPCFVNASTFGIKLMTHFIMSEIIIFRNLRMDFPKYNEDTKVQKLFSRVFCQ